MRCIFTDTDYDAPIFGAKSPPFIKWYEWLFLWLFKTHISRDDQMVVYYKNVFGRLYVIWWEELKVYD